MAKQLSHDHFDHFKGKNIKCGKIKIFHGVYMLNSIGIKDPLVLKTYRQKKSRQGNSF
jgi:hypothetical protein